MRVLWFNWKDIKNPLAGGAEVYTHEIAKRLVRQGFEVILVASKYPKCSSEEYIDGYRVIRVGNKFTVYASAFTSYVKLVKDIKPDIVIDEVNTIPFFTPLYVNEPIIVLIHQLCRDCWRYNTILPNTIGWSIERLFHKVYVYNAKLGKIRRVITVSLSSKKDLISLGYDNNIISIVYNGLDLSRYSICLETKTLYRDNKTLCYVGRLSPYKRIEHILLAYKIIKSAYSDKIKLIIAGRGEPGYVSKLKSYAEVIGGNIVFKINVSHDEKLEILKKCSIMFYTSIREGWGQTVMEAAVCGTPTIAYNVPGLRDSVTALGAGILVEEGNIMELSKKAIELLNNYELRRMIVSKAMERIRYFTWDESARKFKNILEESLS